MDTVGPSHYDFEHWEDVLEACSDSDDSWDDDPDSNCDSIASSLDSNDECSAIRTFSKLNYI